MRIKAKLMGAVSAVILGVVGVASAQTSDTKVVPGAQGLESVDKNLNSHPNDGLENAQKRIEDNMKDREAAKADRDDKTVHAEDNGRHHDKAMRAEKVERAEKAERPERPEHPERAERPERPERPERAGRS